MIINSSSPNNTIKAWQTFLYNQGYKIVGTPDGIWGPHTESGSKAFQRANGLAADGIVGHDTLKAAEIKGFVIPTAQQFKPPGYLNALFDISHLNGNVDFTKAKASGMLGVFHKATQSTTFQDPLYAHQRLLAEQAGLKWGAYHFGAGGDGVAQADFFLNTANPDGKTLLVLDFEQDTTQGQTTMTLQEAKDFINRIKSKTNKYPILYGGSYLKELVRAAPDPVLSQCKLWLAQYSSLLHLPNGWREASFWQFTDGSSGPGALPIDGVGKCDRDLFYGTTDQLEAFWKAHSC